MDGDQVAEVLAGGVPGFGVFGVGEGEDDDALPVGVGAAGEVLSVVQGS